MQVLLLEHPRKISMNRCNDIANAPLLASLISGYIAGVLKEQGHGVEIVEGYLEKLSYDEIREQIRSVKPQLLGVHLVYQWRKDHELYNFLAELKGEGLISHIVGYGFYPTFAYEEILRDCPALDAIILGEPEETFVELVQAVSTGASLRAVPGLAIREQEGILCSSRELIADLDRLPFPVRSKASLNIGEVNLLGSRGCYGACTFCYINGFYGGLSRWRARSPENIVAEIDAVRAQKGMDYFYFTDPNFFGPGKRGQERAKKLASLLKPRQLRFGIEARVNDIHEETVGPLVEAGLSHILIGLESGRDEALKRLNKKTTVAQNERAIKILRQFGIEPNIGFIMFEPDSTIEDIRANFEFLKRNELLKTLEITANVLYHHQIILQGTKAYRQLQQEGRLEISPHSTYEATTSYANPSVALLASIMRDITNLIFARLDDVWSKRVVEPEDAPKRYGEMNRLLVDWFEELLTTLEGGKKVEKEAFLQEALKKTGEVLNFQEKSP